jgi:hypothetical protein
MRKGEYDFSRLRVIAMLKNPQDRYDGVPRKSKLQLRAYRSLMPSKRCRQTPQTVFRRGSGSLFHALH